MSSLRSTVDLGLKPDRQGKVREIFDLGRELFIVATDRISAYDVVMDQIVPGRGVVLSVMTMAWMDFFKEVPNHLVTAEPDLFPAPFRDHREVLAGRSMLVRKAQPFPVECIARGYLSGSGWRSYQQDGTVCGHVLPPGLRKSEPLPAPLFTPSTKAEQGHDENIDFAGACALALVGDDEVSARHARLFVQDRRLLLEDLGSTNGTWLNGVRLLAPTPLREGDVLRVGQTELRLGGIGDSR